MRIVVALGGNALQRPGGRGDWSEAVARFRATVPPLVQSVRSGHELVLTHGNGPQIGQMLRQNELATREVPPRPLPVLGSETQGQIGGLIQRELGAALARVRRKNRVVTLISHVVVDAKDPAFRAPTKPIGREYTEAEARLYRKQEGWRMEYDVGRGGYRRMVASPQPIEWIETGIARTLLESPSSSRPIPIVTGGGGIPVVRRPGGRLEGVEAVIDKDRTAALVARELGADTLAIITDVPGVAVGFGKPWERWLGTVGTVELERHLADGEFADGSMGPKVEAALDFLRYGGRRAIILDIPSLDRGLRGEAGTRITDR